MSEHEHRGLFIGIGRAGKGTLDNFQAEPNTSVVGIVDPAVSEHEAEPVFADLSEALDKTDATIAFISSPNRFHAEHFIACVERGLDIWLEKPFALNMADAQQMLKIGQQAGIKVMTPFIEMSRPSLRDAAEQARQGVFGNVLQIGVIRTGSSGFHSEGIESHYAVRDPAVSGGWLLHHACHVIDWAMQIGGPVVAVTCTTNSTIPDAIEGQEEAMNCLLHFESGATAWVIENQLRVKHDRYTVMGDRGALFIELNAKAVEGQPFFSIQKVTGDQVDYEQLTRSQFAQSEYLPVSPMRLFLDCIEQDRPTPTPVQRSFDVLKICLKLRESARCDGETVRINR